MLAWSHDASTAATRRPLVAATRDAREPRRMRDIKTAAKMYRAIVRYAKTAEPPLRLAQTLYRGRPFLELKKLKAAPGGTPPLLDHTYHLEQEWELYEAIASGDATSTKAAAHALAREYTRLNQLYPAVAPTPYHKP